MAHKTIVIIIKGGDPLCVSAERLTADSKQLHYFINVLNFTELEMDDFHPDTVTLFLTLLEDRNVGEIHPEQFRELHKMAVVFEVDWLTEACSDWVVDKINGIDINMEYEDRLYLFEESRYILKKWELNKFVDLVISKLAAMDNTAFILEYMRDFDKLDSNQLGLMLKLGGSNTRLFLHIILQNLSGKQFLDSNTKSLLDKMNLPLCLEQNEQLCDQMFDTLLAMSELTTTDLRFIFKLSRDSARIAYSRKNRTSSYTTLYDKNEWHDLWTSCTKLEDITSSVEDKRINNVFNVADLLLRVTRLKSPTTEDAEVFFNKLENIWQDNTLNKISQQYIESIISALKLSPRQEKVQLIALLEKLKNNDKLSSCHDNVILSVTTDKVIIVELSTATGNALKFPFEFKHPGQPECHMSGRCGFIIKASEQEGNSKYELCKQDTDYTDTGLHLHDIVSAEEMYYYDTMSGTTQEGNTVRTPSLELGEEDVDWFPSVSDWKLEQCCVSYNVSRYLVAKQD